MNRRNSGAFDIGDDVIGADIGRESGGGVVSGLGIRLIAGQHALDAGLIHRLERGWFTDNTNIGGDSHVNQMRDLVFPTE